MKVHVSVLPWKTHVFFRVSTNFRGKKCSIIRFIIINLYVVTACLARNLNMNTALLMDVSSNLSLVEFQSFMKYS